MMEFKEVEQKTEEFLNGMELLYNLIEKLNNKVQQEVDDVYYEKNLRNVVQSATRMNIRLEELNQSLQNVLVDVLKYATKSA